MSVMDFIKGIDPAAVVAMAFLLYVAMGVVQEWTNVDRYLKALALGLAFLFSGLYMRPTTTQDILQTGINGAVVFFLGWGSSYISSAIGSKRVTGSTVDVPRDVAGGMTSTPVIIDRRRWFDHW